MKWLVIGGSCLVISHRILGDVVQAFSRPGQSGITLATGLEENNVTPSLKVGYEKNRALKRSWQWDNAARLYKENGLVRLNSMARMKATWKVRSLVREVDTAKQNGGAGERETGTSKSETIEGFGMGAGEQ
ncbi:hypothetical protein SRHO_G00124380 [Serrasalmus rhombeus]